MNVIVILNDTLRRDHVGAYGNGRALAATPALDRLASQSIVFDRAYVGSYPTIPNRLDLFTGLLNFPVRGWQPLEPGDRSISEYVRAHGHTTQLVFDPPPLGANEYNFMRGFDGWWWVRGHHADRYITNPRIPFRLECAPHKIRNLDGFRLYQRNRAGWQYEHDYMGPKTLQAAMDWLEDNHTLDGFFLWVDTWHPHEPFDPPEHYLRMYDEPGYTGDCIMYPTYGRARYMSEGERRHLRAHYAGLVSMVDHWVGRLLDKIDQLGLDRNTLVIHTTDHGHLFGEHGLQGKPGAQLGNLYEVSTRIPLMMRLPRAERAGQRVPAIVQPPDILPTILEFLEIPVPANLYGKSLWPLIEGHSSRLREYAFSGRWAEPLSRLTSFLKAGQAFDGWAGSTADTDALTVTGEQWSLVCSPSGRRSELYDLEQDPAQTDNVLDRHRDVASRLHQALLTFLEMAGARPERIQPFLPGPLSYEPGAPALLLDTPLFLVRDNRGQLIAYPTEAEARNNSAAEWGSHFAGSVTFGDLVDQESDALICLDTQFYDVRDLA